METKPDQDVTPEEIQELTEDDIERLRKLLESISEDRKRGRPQSYGVFYD